MQIANCTCIPVGLYLLREEGTSYCRRHASLSYKGLSVRRRGDHLLTQHLESDGRLRRPRQVVVAGHAPQHAHRVVPPQLPVFPAEGGGEGGQDKR